MCAGVMNGHDSAFMGFYGVEPQYQGLGIGRELWAKTVARFGASTNVGLYGVPGMSEKYRKSGFILEDSLQMLIFESERGAGNELNIGALKDINQLPISGLRLELIDSRTNESIFNKLIEFDRSVQRFSREKLLRNYLKAEIAPLTYAIVKDHNYSRRNQLNLAAGERKSFCCAKPSQESIMENETLRTNLKSNLSISNSEEVAFRSSAPIDIPSPVNSPQVTGLDHADASNGTDYEILGYGCIRPDNNAGLIVGPIYADSSDLCEVLLRNLIVGSELQPEGIYSIMALSSNKRACKILTKLGLVQMDQCSRMFTQFAPSASFSKIYFVHSPNFTLF